MAFVSSFFAAEAFAIQFLIERVVADLDARQIHG